jgi:hypothetical protein
MMRTEVFVRWIDAADDCIVDALRTSELEGIVGGSNGIR